MNYTETRFAKLTAALKRRGLPLTLGAGLLIGAGAGANWHGARLAADTGTAVPIEPRTIGGSIDSYAALVDRVSPSVVTVRAERQHAEAASPQMLDPMLRRFFGDSDQMLPRRREPQQRALGSGVIVRGDGHILTNHHVIDGADTITVELLDRRRIPAVLIGSDAPSDLAVLKIDAGEVPALTLGDSEAVAVGDVVLALGNPLGVGQTVTMGIISGKGRATGLGDGSFEDFLQTDAPINTGNSGGALVNTRGELVGINSQILSPTGGNIGIGFAIPAAMARDVMAQLLESGSVKRGQLGVSAQTVDSQIAESLGRRDVTGAIVGDVMPDSAAERAGVRRGDLILAVDGQPVADSNSLRNRVASTPPGTTVTLTIVRAGEEKTIPVTLGELPSQTSGAKAQRGSGGETFGLAVQPLDGQRRRELGVPVMTGVVVTSVAPGSVAAKAGLEIGDVIEQVDGKTVTSAAELKAALSARSDRPALVLMYRGTQSRFLTLDRG